MKSDRRYAESQAPGGHCRSRPHGYFEAPYVDRKEFFSDNISIGKRHALHFYQYTPRANVLAVSSPDADERKWAVENLEGVKVYSDYEEMLSHEGLQAVVIASVTSVHAEQAIKAIQKGLHVLSEKPLSTNVEIVGLPFVTLNYHTSFSRCLAPLAN